MSGMHKNRRGFAGAGLACLLCIGLPGCSKQDATGQDSAAKLDKAVAELAAAKDQAAAELAAVKAQAAAELAAAREQAAAELDAVKRMAALKLAAFEVPPGMAFVPGGQFTMGFEGVATPKHKVTLRPFYMGKHEVTYKLWREVKSFADANRYVFQQPGGLATPWAAPTLEQTEPVNEVTAWDALVWCNAYSEKEGLEPVYKSTDGAVIKNAKDSGAIEAAAFDQVANGYRLPTEAEWEYAARYRHGKEPSPGDHASGAGGPHTDSEATSEVAWFPANSDNRPHPVGQKKANELGLSDMSGNVYEWCWDQYREYESTPENNPTGPRRGNGQVLRGGSFGNSTADLQCAHRLRSSPVNFSVNAGFRVARSL